MKRRDFLKTSMVAGAALSLNFEGLQAALSNRTLTVEEAPDLVAVMGGEPEGFCRSPPKRFLLPAGGVCRVGRHGGVEQVTAAERLRLQTVVCLGTYAHSDCQSSKHN